MKMALKTFNLFIRARACKQFLVRKSTNYMGSLESRFSMWPWTKLGRDDIFGFDWCWWI